MLDYDNLEKQFCLDEKIGEVIEKKYFSKRKREKYRKSTIRKYWSKIFPIIISDKHDICAEEVETPGFCFACKWISGEEYDDCEKAHIDAMIEGGDDHPHNIHMLCAQCHKTSEHMSGRRYWQWVIDSDLTSRKAMLSVNDITRFMEYQK